MNQSFQQTPLHSLGPVLSDLEYVWTLESSYTSSRPLHSAYCTCSSTYVILPGLGYLEPLVLLLWMWMYRYGFIELNSMKENSEGKWAPWKFISRFAQLSCLLLKQDCQNISKHSLGFEILYITIHTNCNIYYPKYPFILFNMVTFSTLKSIKLNCIIYHRVESRSREISEQNTYWQKNAPLCLSSVFLRSNFFCPSWLEYSLASCSTGIRAQ